MAKPKKSKVKTACYVADPVEEIAKKLIPQYHATLNDARIEYVFKAREDDNDTVLRPREIDNLRFGVAQVAGVVDQKMNHWHFRIVMNGNFWEAATAKQREAAVDELLAACYMHEGRPTKVPPDVRGIRVSVYKRRGAWSKELRTFEAAISQQEMPFDDEGEGEKPAAEKPKKKAAAKKTGPTGLVP